MGGSRTSVHVLEFFQDNANLTVTATEVTRATGLEASQVRAAVRNLIARGVSIEVVLAGNAWRYTGMTAPAQPTPTVADYAKAESRAVAAVATDAETFSAIGTTAANGDTIVRSDKTGKLYVAKAI